MINCVILQSHHSVLHSATAANSVNHCVVAMSDQGDHATSNAVPPHPISTSTHSASLRLQMPPPFTSPSPSQSPPPPPPPPPSLPLLRSPPPSPPAALVPLAPSTALQQPQPAALLTPPPPSQPLPLPSSSSSSSALSSGMSSLSSSSSSTVLPVDENSSLLPIYLHCGYHGYKTFVKLRRIFARYRQTADGDRPLKHANEWAKAATCQSVWMSKYRRSKKSAYQWHWQLTVDRANNIKRKRSFRIRKRNGHRRKQYIPYSSSEDSSGDSNDDSDVEKNLDTDDADNDQQSSKRMRRDPNDADTPLSSVIHAVNRMERRFDAIERRRDALNSALVDALNKISQVNTEQLRQLQSLNTAITPSVPLLINQLTPLVNNNNSANMPQPLLSPTAMQRSAVRQSPPKATNNPILVAHTARQSKRIQQQRGRRQIQSKAESAEDDYVITKQVAGRRPKNAMDALCLPPGKSRRIGADLQTAVSPHAGYRGGGIGGGRCPLSAPFSAMDLITAEENEYYHREVSRVRTSYPFATDLHARLDEARMQLAHHVESMSLSDWVTMIPWDLRMMHVPANAIITNEVNSKVGYLTALRNPTEYLDAIIFYVISLIYNVSIIYVQAYMTLNSFHPRFIMRPATQVIVIQYLPHPARHYEYIYLKETDGSSLSSFPADHPFIVRLRQLPPLNALIATDDQELSFVQTSAQHHPHQ